MSPVQRTMRVLREKSCICAMVEKWNAYGGENGVRVDLFGILDIIVLDPATGVIGIQACSTNFKAHFDNLLVEHAQDTHDWLSCPGTRLQLWGWRKLKKVRGGKAFIWTPRIQEITLQDFDISPERNGRR